MAKWLNTAIVVVVCVYSNSNFITIGFYARRDFHTFTALPARGFQNTVIHYARGYKGCTSCNSYLYTVNLFRQINKLFVMGSRPHLEKKYKCSYANLLHTKLYIPLKNSVYTCRSSVWELFIVVSVGITVCIVPTLLTSARGWGVLYACRFINLNGSYTRLI
jgi:hypothetical protein